MATSDRTFTLHQNLALYGGLGTISTLFGTSLFYMSHEFEQDSRGDAVREVKHEVGQRMRIVAFFLFVTGMVLWGLAVSLHSNEKEQKATTTTALLAQIRAEKAQPDIDEHAAFAATGIGLVALGSIIMAYHYPKHMPNVYKAGVIVALGWYMAAIGASSHRKALDTIEERRLAWNLPGATLLILGSLVLPYQIKHGYAAGPALFLSVLGGSMLTLGTSLVFPSE